jgi:hypothetical protein
MIIIYKATGEILQTVWDRNKFLISTHPYETMEIDETDANLPDLNKIMQAVSLFDDSGYTVEDETVQLDGNPVAFETDTIRQQVRDEYVSTIATLESYEGYTSPSNAQVVGAVKFIAKTLKLLLKLLKRTIE